MKSCLNAISTILAAICAFLFVFVAALTLYLFIADRMLLSAGAYKQALRGQNFYEHLPALIAEQIIYQEAHNISDTGLTPELKRLTQSDWEILISEILTPDALQTQTESVIDQFFVYLNTPSKELKLKVSLVEFKQKLDGDAGYRAVMHIVDAQPDCNSEEWAAFIASGSYQFEDVPFCRPPTEVVAASEPYIRDALHDLTAAIPNETFLDNNATASTRTTSTDDGRDDLQRVRRWIWLSLCLPVGLLLLTAVFGVRSFTGCGLWLGLPPMFTGLFTFIAALITWRLPSWLIARNAPGGQVTIEGLAPGLTQALVDVGISIAHSAARTLGLIGILLILLGMGVLIAGFLFGMARRGIFSG
jgi:hypothetical protein